MFFFFFFLEKHGNCYFKGQDYNFKESFIDDCKVCTCGEFSNVTCISTKCFDVNNGKEQPNETLSDDKFYTVSSSKLKSIR